MADLANLRTASLYINNQLLSRGLLRDGEVLDFSDPSRYDGGTGAAMGRIMGIVNDLILRRDRDAEHRESLSTTLRSLRADNLRQTTDLTRLAEKQAETERKLNISEAAEASARAQLKSAEAAVRGLKDEMARVKTLVAQTRASCATEVRRRDRNIDGLKKQLGEATRARGSVRNPAITVISVTGDIGLERGPSSGRAGDTSDSQYDLRSETNEFLTELAKGLSEENEALSALLRRMREELRGMSGWEQREVEGADGHAVDVTTNVDELEADLNAVLDHMRTILTNPSFVPLEEVVTREEEITRLREGWVKMESRWKEAVQLIDEWRRRMATSGMPVDDEEMDLSLRLSPMRVRGAKEPARVVSLGLASVKEEEAEEEKEEELELEVEEEYADVEQPIPAEDYHLADDSVDLIPGPPADDLPASDAESSVFDDPADMEEIDDEEPNVEILQQSATISQPLQLSVDSSPLPEPPQLSPLKDSSSAGNRRETNELAMPRHKARGYTTTVEEETCELVEETHTQERFVTKRRTQSRPTRTAPSYSKRQKVEPEPEPEVVNSSVSSLDSILLDSPSRRRRTQLRTRAGTRPRPSTTSARTSEIRASEVRTREATLRQARETKASPPPNDPEPAHSLVPMERAPTREAPAPAQLSPKRTISRVPLARPDDPAPQQSPLTMAAIAAKLAASEREADAARVRAKLKAARTARRRTELAAPMPEAAASEAHEEQEKERDVDPVKRDQGRRIDSGEEAGAAEGEVPVKRKRDRRTSKVASRRRSTLSPWELESLISGNVVASQAD